MALDLIRSTYNPDVLTCLANLSSDEVFTPPEVVNQMLDMLPQELFSNPDTTFLDPATKSGVFLREIAKRLMKGLEQQIPDLQERVDHIFQKQLFGIAMTELTSLLARRSLYCSKYPNSSFSVTRFHMPEGNIRFRRTPHTWQDGRCIYCGASKTEYDRDEGLETHAYEWLHYANPEEIYNMKFDVIISNPPYQLETGGGSEHSVAATQAKPLFHMFVEQAKKLNPRYLSMIIPARWYNGGIGLSDFRNTMLNDKHITKLVDYVDSNDCFNGVGVAGGICYFLWERDRTSQCEVVNRLGNTENTTIRDLNEFEGIFIRANEAISILHKVMKKAKTFVSDLAYPIDAFGFPSKARGVATPFDGCVKLIHSKGIGYVKREDIKKNKEIIDKYKVTIGILVPCNGEVGVDPSKGYKSITTPRILKPGEIITFSYLVVGAFDTEQEAENFRNYLMCKFPRYMLRLTFSSMHIAKNNFSFVPLVDFTMQWTDEKLYGMFGLNDKEVGIIESTMRDMNDSETD